MFALPKDTGQWRTLAAILAIATSNRSVVTVVAQPLPARFETWHPHYFAPDATGVAISRG